MVRRKRTTPRKAIHDARIAAADAWAAELAPTLAEIQASGVTSLHGIAAALYKRGIRTRRGERGWQATQVKRALARL
jgi:hypothetical protein